MDCVVGFLARLRLDHGVASLEPVSSSTVAIKLSLRPASFLTGGASIGGFVWTAPYLVRFPELGPYLFGLPFGLPWTLLLGPIYGAGQRKSILKYDTSTIMDGDFGFIRDNFCAHS